MTLVTVTRAQFFAAIMKTKIDVHPRPEKEITYWKARNREVLGTSPGYSPQGPECYLIRADLV